jgi:hypothetical protein
LRCDDGVRKCLLFGIDRKCAGGQNDALTHTGSRAFEVIYFGHRRPALIQWRVGEHRSIVLDLNSVGCTSAAITRKEPSKSLCFSDFTNRDSETVRPWMSWIHIAVGFSVPVLFARSRARPSIWSFVWIDQTCWVAAAALPPVLAFVPRHSVGCSRFSGQSGLRGRPSGRQTPLAVDP